MIRFKQSGDTIVEVLIAMLVVSVVLAGAYAAAIRSQKSTQQAQEHTTALKLAESQLEQLNIESANPGSAIYGAPPLNIFCFNPTNNTLLASGEIKDSTDTTVVNSPMPSLNTALTYHNCKVSNGVDYNIAVDRSDTDPYVFTVHIRWDSIQGGGQDEVTLTYRVDKPS